jgi:hypothetical protein
MEYLLILKNFYLYWVYISIFLYIIILIIGIFIKTSQKYWNLKIIWIRYNIFFYSYDIPENEKLWDYIWAFILISTRFLLSWILVIDLIHYFYRNNVLSKPNKIKEINYKLSNFALNEKQVSKLVEEFSNFTGVDWKYYMK